MSEGSQHKTRPVVAESRTERRRLRTRTVLLDAARRVFAERGFHDTSIADITAAADVGVGTFYLHFRDKDDVLRTLVLEGMAEVQIKLAAAVGQMPRYRAFPLALRLLLREAYGRRDLFTLALSSGTRPGLAVRAAFVNFLESILDDAAEHGMLEDHDTQLQARLVSGVVMMAMQWWLDQDEPDPDAMADYVLHFLGNGLPAALLAGDEAAL